MLDRSAQLATRYVRTHEAARLLGLSPRTLEKYRCHGSGPTFRKLGGRVVYAIDDLEAWADQAACRSTSDPRYVEAQREAIIAQYPEHEREARTMGIPKMGI